MAVDIYQLDKDGLRMYDDDGNYIPKGKRKKTEIAGIEKIENGLLLVIKGHAPAGEKTKIIYYGFNEEKIKKVAADEGAYVYQLIYSARKTGNPCGSKD